MKFDNKISIDGVAVIVTAIMAAMYMGHLNTVVENLQKSQAEQDSQIVQLNKSQSETTRQLAVVATMVNDMRKNP